MEIKHMNTLSIGTEIIANMGKYNLPTRIVIKDIRINEIDYMEDNKLCTEKLCDIKNIKYPITSNQVREMYDKWFNDKTIDYTNEFSSLSYCQYGDEKFEANEYRMMYEMRTDINTSNFLYNVGDSYELQNGTQVTVLGRTDMKNYECLICSDGIYRYDRSNTRCIIESGRVTGSCIEYTDHLNILNKEIGNRFKYKSEYMKLHNLDEMTLGGSNRLSNDDRGYIEFLKKHNRSTLTIERFAK